MSPEGFLLLLASVLSFAVGLMHLIYGERFIFMHLNQLESPKLSGQPEKTKCALRAAWHCVTIALWAISFLFLLMAQAPIAANMVSSVLAWMFSAMVLVTILITRGRYLIWPAFVAISLIAFWSAHQL